MAAGCGSDGSSGDEQDASVAECGNGEVEAGEECDDGNGTSGDGCEPDCTFTCNDDADCDDGEPCNGQETCNPALHRCQQGTPLEAGASCTLEAPGGTSDGGVGDGGAPGTVEGKCVDERCGVLCDPEEGDAQCDDGNPCNGTESCHAEHGACAAGTPPDCDDGLECTVDSCDETCEECATPEDACVHTLVDEDGDGFAPSELDCDEAREGDCNDEDPEINPVAVEDCSDDVDNDCDGTVNEANIWYQDCDGDGYATADAMTSEGCAKPGTTESCIDWTTRTPSGAVHTDCDDTNAGVYPGAENEEREDGRWTRPYCRTGGAPGGSDITFASGSYGSYSCSGGGYPNWDFNCNGSSDYFSDTSEYSCGLFACSGGWAGSRANCGQYASWQNCGEQTCSCSGFPQLCICDCDNASTTSKQQTCR